MKGVIFPSHHFIIIINLCNVKEDIIEEEDKKTDENEKNKEDEKPKEGNGDEIIKV